jgi:hypothetical protein
VTLFKQPRNHETTKKKVRVLFRGFVLSWLARHSVGIIGAIALSAYIIVTAIPLFDTPPIRSDGYSYYVYLPSLLLWQDPTLERVAADCCAGTYPAYTGLRRWPPTGRWLDPHPIGVALHMLPLFVGAHLLTRWSNMSPDGFSPYYQHAAALAGLLYMVAGLAILRRTLSRQFTDGVVLATLVAVTFGTNLFHYGVVDATFSHVFAFFTVCALVELTVRWWEQPTVRRTFALGAIGALVILTRHTNAICLLLIPLYGTNSWRDLRSLPQRLWQRRSSLLAMAAMVAACVFPQLLLYKVATNHWAVSPYAAIGAKFYFTSPHIRDVLFSTQKGLFFWSPVLLLAVAGMTTPRGTARTMFGAAIVVLALDTYLIASWDDWQFGGSFGHRGFTDALGILALFLASFFEWAAARRRIRPFVIAGAGLAVTLSAAQMIQYWIGILPIADTTWERYLQVFLKFT